MKHDYEFSGIVSNPLDRAQQTAEILNASKLTSNGAEKYINFKERVAKGPYKAMMYPGPVLIISHGGVY